MVRRPLLILLAAYCIGSLLYKVPVAFMFCLIGLCCLTVVFFLGKVSKNRHDMILLIVPVFLFLGYLLMGNQQSPGPLDYLFSEDSKVYTNATGIIHKIESSSTSYKLTLQNVRYDIVKDSSDAIIVYLSDVTGLAIGNEIRVCGELSMFQSPTNAYQFDTALYYKIQGIDYKMIANEIVLTNDSVSMPGDMLYRLRCRMDQVFERIEDEQVVQSLKAMLLGEKSAMEEETNELYQSAGISHIISISGLHISLLGMAIFMMVRYLVGIKAGVACSASFILLYGILTNFSVSTNRAVVMLILFLAANIAGKCYDFISAIALSALIILIRQPMQIYQCGFLLSFGAVAGIALIYPCFLSIVDLERIKEKKPWNDEEVHFPVLRGVMNKIHYWIVSTFLLQCSILAVTFPILLSFYYRYATYSFVANLLILPLMSYVVFFGLAGAVAGLISSTASSILLYPAVSIVKWYLSVCSATRSLPRYYLVLGAPSIYKIILFFLCILLGSILMRKKYRIGAALFFSGFLIFFYHQKNTELIITSIDVGQGDCYVLQTPNGHVYMVDGGSTSENEVGKYRILPYLYGNGIDTIDYIFVTHADTDHISGIKELLEESGNHSITVSHLVVSYTGFEDDNYEELCKAAEENGVEIIYMEQRNQLVDGELLVQCIHPTYEYEPASANDYSLVLSFSYKDFSMLMTGDLSSEAEEELFKTDLLLDYDILKIAHHGSKNSTSTEFLEKTRPEIALISCGENNSYGHPHKELLDRLAKANASTYITAENGMIIISTDGERILISSYITGE